MEKVRQVSEFEVLVGEETEIYKKGSKPSAGIDVSSLTPEFIEELTQGSEIDRHIAAFRWLNAHSESKEGQDKHK
jgi:hypothetical protein